MITADAFMGAAAAAGFDFYTGVPCSYLTPLINGVLSNRSLRYVGAASEGEAVAIAAGAWLAGRQTVAMCQNSGLGNMVNPLTSLNAPFAIPTLLITTWRGRPGEPDEPQHAVMGEITGDLLALMGIEQRPFPNDTDDVAPALGQATAAMAASSRPFAFVMAKGDVADTALDQPPRALPAPGRYTDHRRHGARPTRVAVLERFLALTDDDTAVIATTGKSGRELFTLADRAQHLYQVGSMGGATPSAWW
jgi:phosphonopyruvate decarboxylase